MGYSSKLHKIFRHILFRILVFIILSIVIFTISSDYREFAIVMIPVFLSQLLTQVSSIEEKKVETAKGIKGIQAVTELVSSKSNLPKVNSDGITPRPISSGDIYDWLRQENLIDENQYKHLKSKTL